MTRTVKVVGGVAVAALVAAATWSMFGREREQAPPFLTAAVDRGTVIQHVGTTGSLTAVTTVKVGSQVSGIIATLHADFNDRVTKGQVLATLDPTPFEAAVNQTRAQLESANVAARDAMSKFKRQKALYDAQLSSEDQLDSARATLDQARAQVTELTAALDRAEANLQYTVIRSPIDGVVVSRDYDVGQTVAASFQAPTLFTIAEDLTRMQLTCDVDEADIGQVKVGQPVTFTVDTFPERAFAGTVAQIRLSPKTDNNVVTYPVIVDVANPDLSLLPGMTAEVKIEVARADNVLRLPTSAMRFRPELLGLQAAPPARGAGANRPERPQHGAEQSARVYVAPDTPQGTLKAVSFEPGLTDGQYVQIKSGGLAEGQKIIVGVATSQGQDVGGIAGMGPFGRRRR